MTQTHPSRSAEASAPLFRPELAFPHLTDDMMVRLRSYGREERFESGTVLFTRGHRDVDMFVVLAGTIEVYAVALGGKVLKRGAVSVKVFGNLTPNGTNLERRLSVSI